MRHLHAEFREPADAVAAIERLAAAGMDKGGMELYSRRPIEEYPAALRRRSFISLGAVVSAILVGGIATALMFAIQRDYPLVTGGMPIVSGWATAVVTFETTMAGAVLGICLMLLWESGLVGRRQGTPVPHLPDEGVVLQVRCGADSGVATGILEESGAVRVEASDSRAGG